MSDKICLKEWVPSADKLIGRAACAVGWKASGKSVLCKDIAYCLGAKFYPNDFNIVIQGQTYVIEIEGGLNHESLCTERNAQKLLIDSVQCFSSTKPDVRQYFQYIFICGRLSERDLERVFDCYKHFLDLTKEEFLEIGDLVLCNYKCLVIDVSYEARIGYRTGELFSYCPKLWNTTDTLATVDPTPVNKVSDLP